MIDFQNEELLTLREATVRIPGRPHISTVFRWTATEKLDSIRVGGRRFTSVAAIRRMIDDGSGQRLHSQPTQQREQQISKAERELADDNI